MRVHAVVVHFGDSGPTERLSKRLTELQVPMTIVWNDPNAAVPASLRDVSIQPEENLGFGRGVNRGVRSATKNDPTVEAIWILNHDAYPEDGCLEALTAALASQSRLAAVGPRIVDEHGIIWHDGGEIHWPEARVESRGFGLPLSVEVASRSDPVRPNRSSPESSASPGVSELVRPTGFVCGCAPLVELSAFEAVQGFDRSYFLYFEDVDLSNRLETAGYSIGHVPTALCRHRGGAATERRREVAIEHRLRSRLRYIREHAPDHESRANGLARVRRRAMLRSVRYLMTGRISGFKAIRRALRAERR